MKESVLNGVPKSLPQLLRAYEIQKKAGKVGFDWVDVQPMIESFGRMARVPTRGYKYG